MFFGWNQSQKWMLKNGRISSNLKLRETDKTGRTSLIVPTERRVVPRAKAAAVMHHNSWEIVHVTVCTELCRAVLLHIQLRAKLHADRYLATITPTRPPASTIGHKWRFYVPLDTKRVISRSQWPSGQRIWLRCEKTQCWISSQMAVFTTTAAATYSLGYGLYLGTAVPRSTKPSTLHRTVKWVSAFGLSNNNKWRWWCGWQHPTGRLTAQVDWLGVRAGGHQALHLHSSSEPGELSKWLWPSRQHCKDCQVIIIIIISTPHQPLCSVLKELNRKQRNTKVT